MKKARINNVFGIEAIQRGNYEGAFYDGIEIALKNILEIMKSFDKTEETVFMRWRKTKGTIRRLLYK